MWVKTTLNHQIHINVELRQKLQTFLDMLKCNIVEVQVHWSLIEKQGLFTLRLIDWWVVVKLVVFIFGDRLLVLQIQYHLKDRHNLSLAFLTLCLLTYRVVARCGFAHNTVSLYKLSYILGLETYHEWFDPIQWVSRNFFSRVVEAVERHDLFISIGRVVKFGDDPWFRQNHRLLGWLLNQFFQKLVVDHRLCNFTELPHIRLK